VKKISYMFSKMPQSRFLGCYRLVVLRISDYSRHSKSRNMKFGVCMLCDVRLAGLFKDPDLFQTRNPNEDRNDIFNYIHFQVKYIILRYFHVFDYEYITYSK
jgi:hypothetical protein